MRRNVLWSQNITKSKNECKGIYIYAVSFFSVGNNSPITLKMNRNW